MTKLSNLKTLITGGSSGIGRAIALTYAKEGADIVLTYKHNEDGAHKVVNEIIQQGRKAAALQVDLANIAKLDKVIVQSIAFLGGIDILVNNAGTLTRHSHLLDISIADLNNILSVNLKAPFILTQLVAKHMIENKIKGNIINITSMSAEIITPGLAHYECSKAAMNALTKSSASALAQYGIRVNAIAPGLIATNINQKQRENDPIAWNNRKKMIPLGRVGLPEDIASLALLLASKDSEWMTGSIIPFDGGAGVVAPFSLLSVNQ